MSWRERIGGKSADDGSFAASTSQQDSADAEAAEMFGVGEGAVHPCWQPVTLPSGLHIYENRYTGHTHTIVIVSAAMLSLLAVHTSSTSLEPTPSGCRCSQHITVMYIVGLKSAQQGLSIRELASTNEHPQISTSSWHSKALSLWPVWCQQPLQTGKTGTSK